MPYTQTNFSQAIFKMFEGLDSYLERSYDNLPDEAVDFDGNFNPTIAPVHPDYKNRSLHLHTTKSKLVSLYLVSAVDIAISKLGRFESVDREDIVNLFQKNMFTIEEFIETAEEAKKYCGVATDKLEFNIKEAMDILKEEAQ
jgi:Nucleotidyltransferase of unknown function (DUF6036)